MKYFLHALDHIRIINGLKEFNCTPERFAELEPGYPGLPEGIESRYWTPEKAHFNDGSYDGHDCESYCDKVSQYTEYPLIYVDVSLSKTTLCGCDPNDVITFSVTLKDEAGNTLPVDYTWLVRLSHEEEGDIDRIQLDFVQGECTALYRFPVGALPYGTWRIDDSKFDAFEFGGVTYKFTLISPVSFVVYRYPNG